jgi:hypothetical protein
MRVRLSGVTLGGQLSLSYLLVATLLLIFGGRWSEWFLMILGFPLMWAAGAYTWAFGETGQPPPEVAAAVVVLLWIGNAYLWGHVAAAVARRVGRWLDKRTGRTDGAGSS